MCDISYLLFFFFFFLRIIYLLTYVQSSIVIGILKHRIKQEINLSSQLYYLWGISCISYLSVLGSRARTSGTPCLCPRAYKACVRRISCRCGIESKGFPNMGRTRGGNSCRLRTKPCGLGSPKRTNSLCGNSPTQKGTFEGKCPSQVLSALGIFTSGQGLAL